MNINMKREAIHTLAFHLKDLGFDVYIQDARGFCYIAYADENAQRVCCVQADDLSYCYHFSGAYRGSRESGTGWKIAELERLPTKEEAQSMLHRNAPHWANPSPIYHTLDSYLKQARQVSKDTYKRFQRHDHHDHESFRQ